MTDLTRRGRPWGLGLLAALCLLGWPLRALALAPTPAQSAEAIRASLVSAQLSVAANAPDAQAAVRDAQAGYEANLAGPLGAADAAAAARVAAGFDALADAVNAGQVPAYAAARAQVWTALLAGSYHALEAAIERDDGAAAQTWLALREFRTATRFSRPNADATLAVAGLAAGQLAPADALPQVRADLLDTYQARLGEALRDLRAADASGFAARRAELATLAAGYFDILSAAYAAQHGAEAQATALAAFAQLQTLALGAEPLDAALAHVDEVLAGFRAAPLDAAEQARRAGQLLRFLALVPVEYGRGVYNGQVTRDIEIQEALTFHAGAQAAFADLQDQLAARDAAATAQIAAGLDTLGAALLAAGQGTAVAEASDVQAQTEALQDALAGLMPEGWRAGSTQGDFDVIASLLDQMESAAAAGDYGLAESARLEAYAVMETGPEARLMVFAPQLKLTLEELFWNGQGEAKGLAYLLKQQAPLETVKASRGALDAALTEAQTTLGVSSAPAAVAANAGLIVFREGLEAVLILASLLSSLKRPEERRYRQPMWLGTLLALVATALTWLLAREVLQALARYGEKLEVIVSLIAIGVLLLITNWFFHKVYWTNWIAGFHAQKRKLLTGEAGLWLGLALLGFTSVYREGFETVLFLQALVLEGGTQVVLLGVVAALALVVVVGVITFRLQVNLPYKKMLIVTGVLIGVVLLQMVGNTVHSLQVVGWLPIHLVNGLPLPYWVGTWMGVYATWEGLGFQAAAAAFVLGSYFLAEHSQKKALRRPMSAAAGG